MEALLSNNGVSLITMEALLSNNGDSLITMEALLSNNGAWVIHMEAFVIQQRRLDDYQKRGCTTAYPANRSPASRCPYRFAGGARWGRGWPSSLSTALSSRVSGPMRRVP